MIFISLFINKLKKDNIWFKILLASLWQVAVIFRISVCIHHPGSDHTVMFLNIPFLFRFQKNTFSLGHKQIE